MAQIQIFLSCVSAEFGRYRDVLRHYLNRPNVTVKVQEDFIVTGTETLDMLDAYIAQCDVVIHLVGDMTGTMAQAPSVEAIATRYPDLCRRFPIAAFLQTDAPSLSYTQWEAWLALYHGKRLIIAAPEKDAERDVRYTLDPSQQAAQQAHLARLAQVERYPFKPPFRSADHFAAEVWRSGLLDLLIEAGLVRKVVHLRHLSLGDLFKGRASLLDELSARFGPVLAHTDRPAAVTALTGMGGVGKTRLAVEYAWRQTSNYPAMFLVGADSDAALNTNLAALCGATILDLPERDETDEARRRDAVVRWLQTHQGWLLILDNVDSKPAASAVKTLLPQLIGGHVLITSRLTNWSGSIRAIEVKELSPDAATDFLLARTDGRRRRQADDDAVAQTLATELGYLALALEQAGAYIAYRTDSFGHYLATWQSKRAAMLGWHDPDLMEYPSSVAATWQTSFEQLGEPARRLLERLAWLAPDPVPESLLEVAVPGDVTDSGAPFDALAELKAYSLATRAADAPFFSVHKLVQEATRRAQSGEPVPVRLLEALNWVNEAFVGDPQNVRDWPMLDPLAPHAQAVATVADEGGLPTPTAGLFSQLGSLQFSKALYQEAERLLRRALAIDEARFGADHPDVARDLSNLAALLQATNRMAKAEPMMRRALSISEASFGADHPDVARDLANLAVLLQATNRWAEAEPLMRRAQLIHESTYGAGHPRVALDLNNLAALLQATNRLAEAEPLMRRALSIDEASFGPDHPHVARDLANLSALLKATNRLAEAEPLMRRSLGIEETSVGPNHPTVAIHLNNLATLLQATSRLAEAEPLLHRALAIDEASFGENHPNVARDLANLAKLLQAANRLAEAEPLMRRALTIATSSFGADHPNVAIALNNLATLLRATNRLAEAELLLRRALAIDEASFGQNHPNVACYLSNLAGLLQAKNRLAEAEPLMHRALTIATASFGADHPNVAIALNNLALLLKDTNQPAEAEPLIRWALKIEESSFGAHHPNVATALNNLALLLKDTNRYAEAEPLMRRALKINESSLGAHHLNVARDLHNLAHLLQATSRLAKAEPLMRRALGICIRSLGEVHPRTRSVEGNYIDLLNAMGTAEDDIRVALASLRE